MSFFESNCMSKLSRSDISFYQGKSMFAILLHLLFLYKCVYVIRIVDLSFKYHS